MGKKYYLSLMYTYDDKVNKEYVIPAGKSTNLYRETQKKNILALLLDRNIFVSILPEFTPQRDSLQPHKSL